MSSKMSSKLRNLFLEEDVGERVFEIRIRDLKARNSAKQRSFSIMAKKGAKRREYISAEGLTEFLRQSIRNRGIKNE